MSSTEEGVLWLRRNLPGTPNTFSPAHGSMNSKTVGHPWIDRLMQRKRRTADVPP
jgi:hypothetical protein